MSFANYAALQASVADWMHRNDLTGRIPDFITLAEKRIARMLNSRLQGLTVGLVTTPGVQYEDLPSDLLRIKSASIPTLAPRMSYVTMDQLNLDYNPDTSGTPQVYSVLGSLIYFGPTPDSAYSVSLSYEFEIPALSDLAPLNTLLARWPDAYLWGTLAEACEFAEKNEKAATYDAKLSRTLDEINRLDWNVSGPMRMRSDVRYV